MANKSEVIVEINEKKTVATIFLNRPEKANSLNGNCQTLLNCLYSLTLTVANMVTILRKSFQDLEANNEVRVIVLTGSGKYFCSGMDLSSQSHSVEDTTKGFIELMETIYKCKKPVICKINGPALGGGLGLVFVTDIRIMNKESYLVFPEVKRGIVPAMISAYIVPQLGIYKSKQYMLSGEKISSSELLNDRVISLLANDSSSLDKMTDSVVNQLISSAPNVVIIPVKYNL